MALLGGSGFDPFSNTWNSFPSGGRMRRMGATTRFHFTSSGTPYGTGKKWGNQLNQFSALSYGSLGNMAYGIGSFTGDLVVGFDFQWGGASGAARNAVFSLANANGDQVAGLAVLDTGYLIAYGGADIGQDGTGTGDSPIVATAAIRPVIATEHQYLEAQIGASKFQVWINGESIFNYTSSLPFDGSGNGWASTPVDVMLGAGGRINNYTVPTCRPGDYYDDFYLLDTGGGGLNSRLGPQRITPRLPNAESQNTGYVASGGSTIADRLAVLDDDTTHYAADAVNDEHIVTSTDTLPIVPAAINGVILNHISRKENAGARAVDGRVFLDSTDFDAGSPQFLSTTYGIHQHIYEQNPDTTMEWAKAEVEACPWGYFVDS